MKWLIFSIILSIFTVDPARSDAVLNGFKITDEKVSSDFNTGTFIAPNELAFHTVRPVLTGRQGVFISVGTFCALNMAAMGSPSHLVMMDVDPFIVAFNRLNLALIRMANNRYEYLSLLFRGGIEERFIARLKWLEANNKTLASAYTIPDDLETGRKKDLDIALNLRANFGEMTIPVDIVQRWKGLGLEFEGASGKKVFELLEMMSERTYPPQRPRRPIYRHLLRTAYVSIPAFVRLGAYKYSYMGKNRVFNRIKNMAEKGEILIVTGDITGGVTLLSLAQALKKSDLEVGAMNISNILDYVGESGIKKLVKNLRRLPWAEDGNILSTAIIRRIRAHLGELKKKFMDRADPDHLTKWMYYAWPSEMFAQELYDFRKKFMSGPVHWNLTQYRNTHPSLLSRSPFLSSPVDVFAERDVRVFNRLMEKHMLQVFGKCSGKAPTK